VSGIDWLAVEWVCHGASLALKADEKRMVIRRLSPRMLANNESWMEQSPHKLSAQTVAERLRTTDRTVQRIRDGLPPATRGRCPDCGEPVWVLTNGFIEPHSNNFYEDCGDANGYA